MFLCVSRNAPLFQTLVSNKNKSIKSYISHSCYWQIVLVKMFLCKSLHAILPLTSTELNTVVIIFGTLAVSTFEENCLHRSVTKDEMFILQRKMMSRPIILVLLD